MHLLEQWGSKCPQCQNPVPFYKVMRSAKPGVEQPPFEEFWQVQRKITMRWCDVRTVDLKSEIWSQIYDTVQNVAEGRFEVNQGLKDKMRRIPIILLKVLKDGLRGALWGFLAMLPTLGLSVPIGFWFGVGTSVKRKFYDTPRPFESHLESTGVRLCPAEQDRAVVNAFRAADETAHNRALLGFLDRIRQYIQHARVEPVTTTTNQPEGGAPITERRMRIVFVAPPIR